MAIRKLDIPEGYVFNKYLETRFRKNQNVLSAITGSTGSGKSYVSLRIAELWYQHNFNNPFPIENCCFSIREVMQKLNSKELKKGELLIIEEGGVLLNNLDFQNQISKLFSFVLQSFRSMNIGLIINLPVLSMLNKSTRLLLHAHMITHSIDYNTNTCKLKPFFHQLNQQTGKIYPKYMRIKYNGKVQVVERFNYGLPSKELIEQYEKKKHKFVSDLNEDFVKKLDLQAQEEDKKLARNNLTSIQQEVYGYVQDGKNVKEIAELRGSSLNSIYDIMKGIKKRGFVVKIQKNAKEIQVFKG